MSTSPSAADGGLEARLDRLEARLDRIESGLERLIAVLDQASPAIATAVDTADEWIRHAQDRGIDPDARAAAAGRLVEAATEPEVLDRLASVAGRLGVVEDTVAMAADIFDEAAAEAAVRGIDLDERAAALATLAERLTASDNARTLLELVDALPDLAPVVRLATTFEATVAMLFDMFDDHVAAWAEEGIDAEARVLAAGHLLRRLTDPELYQHIEVLLDAAPGLMAATRTGELFGHAVDDVQASPPAPVGPAGMVRALFDPQVQRAVGFALAVARQIGTRLPTHDLPVRS